MRVIDDKGENLGILSTRDALAKAKEQNLDLVEINPKAEPPVAKICDLGKFLYQQKKDERKQRAKQKKEEVKKIRLTFGMGQHDLEMRTKQVEKFLEQGNKAHIELFMRGREKGKKFLAEQKLRDFLKEISIEFREINKIQKTPRSFFIVIGK